MWKMIKNALFLKDIRQNIALLQFSFLLQSDIIERIDRDYNTSLDAIVALSLRIVELEKIIHKNKNDETRKKGGLKRTAANNNSGRKTLLRSKK